MIEELVRQRKRRACGFRAGIPLVACLAVGVPASAQSLEDARFYDEMDLLDDARRLYEEVAQTARDEKERASAKERLARLDEHDRLVAESKRLTDEGLFSEALTACDGANRIVRPLRDRCKGVNAARDGAEKRLRAIGTAIESGDVESSLRELEALLARFPKLTDDPLVKGEVESIRGRAKAVEKFRSLPPIRLPIGLRVEWLAGPSGAESSWALAHVETKTLDGKSAYVVEGRVREPRAEKWTGAGRGTFIIEKGKILEVEESDAEAPDRMRVVSPARVVGRLVPARIIESRGEREPECVEVTVDIDDVDGSSSVVLKVDGDGRLCGEIGQDAGPTRETPVRPVRID